MVQQAVDTFGRLDVARQQRRHPARPHAGQHERGRVGRGDQGPPEGHLRPARHAAALLARASPRRATTVDARIINTTSVSGIYGNLGQTNYGAAKMGIAAFTIIAARELKRYGVTVNAIAPGALTRLTEALRQRRAHRGAAAKRDVAALDRADRHVAREHGVARRHRPRVRSVGPRPRRRRGLAPRPDRRPPSTTRSKIGPIALDLVEARAPQRRHGRPGPRLSGAVVKKVPGTFLTGRRHRSGSPGSSC